MKAKKLAGVLGLTVSIPGLIAALAAVPMAAATSGDQTADTTSVITTEEECTWYLLNAPGTLTLAPATAGTEYEGIALDISATVTDFNVHSSGNQNAGDETTHQECTFYGDGNKSRPIVTVTASDSAFDAAYVDSDADGTPTVTDDPMSFTVTDTNALDLTWAANNCDAKWAQTDLTLYGADGATTLSEVILEITDVATVTSNVAATADANDRCKEDITVGVQIPANMKPASPGDTYTWTGPTVTTALTTSTSN